MPHLTSDGARPGRCDVPRRRAQPRKASSSLPHPIPILQRCYSDPKLAQMVTQRVWGGAVGCSPAAMSDSTGISQPWSVFSAPVMRPVSRARLMVARPTPHRWAVSAADYVKVSWPRGSESNHVALSSWRVLPCPPVRARSCFCDDADRSNSCNCPAFGKTSSSHWTCIITDASITAAGAQMMSSEGRDCRTPAGLVGVYGIDPAALGRWCGDRGITCWSAAAWMKACSYMLLTKDGGRLTAAMVMLWGVGAVLLALFATLSMSVEHITANAAWWVHADPGVGLVRWLVVLVGVLTMVAAWLLLSRVPHLVDRPYWLLGAFAVLMLMMPPLLSTDVYAYFEAGWMQAQHLNPYTTPVGSLLRSPVYAHTQSWWGTYTPYGPGALWLFHGVGAVTGYDPVAFIASFRSICVAAIFAMVPLVRSIARSFGVAPRYAVWAGLLNPLMLIHGIGGAHIDIPAIFFVVVGVRLALVPRWWPQVAAMVAMGFAASIRQPAAIVGLFVCVTAGRLLARSAPQVGRRARTVLIGACGVSIGVASVELVTVGSGVGWGWIHNLETPKLSPLTPVGFFTVLAGRGTPPVWLSFAAVIVGVVLARRLAQRVLHVNPLLAVAGFFLVFQVVSMASYHTWYYLLPFVLLACCARGRSLSWLVPFAVLLGTAGQGLPGVLDLHLGNRPVSAIIAALLALTSTVALLHIARRVIPSTGDISCVIPRRDVPRKEPVLVRR